MKLYNISEARRNPDHPAQQKQSSYEHMKKYSDDDSIFVSYTQIDKLGINPRSSYNTPIGIYTYPLKIVFKKYIEPTKNVRRVPFAGRQPYIQVAKLDSNVKILSIPNYNKSDFEKDLDKLYQWVEDKKLNLYKPRSDFDYYVREYSRQSRVKSEAGIIWNVTRLIADYYAKDKNKNSSVVWAYILFNVLGYYGVIDEGDSIIHPSEPEQAVFFNIGALTIVDKIENKNKVGISVLFNSDSNEYDQIEKAWKLLPKLDTKNLEKFIKYGINNQMTMIGMDEVLYRYLDTSKISPALERKFIEKNPSFIKYIKNPKEDTLRWYAENKLSIDSNTPIAELYSEEYWIDMRFYNIDALLFIKNPTVEFVNKVSNNINSLKPYAFLSDSDRKNPSLLDININLINYIPDPTRQQLDKVVDIMIANITEDNRGIAATASDIIKKHYMLFDKNQLNKVLSTTTSDGNYIYSQRKLLLYFVEKN